MKRLMVAMLLVLCAIPAAVRVAQGSTVTFVGTVKDCAGLPVRGVGVYLSVFSPGSATCQYASIHRLACRISDAAGNVTFDVDSSNPSHWCFVPEYDADTWGCLAPRPPCCNNLEAHYQYPASVVEQQTASGETGPIVFDIPLTYQLTCGTTDVPGPGGAIQTALLAPIPNPSTSRALVAFTLGAPHTCRVEIIDVWGRRVRTLANESFTVGRHEIAWDGKTEQGSKTPPGAYWIRLIAGNTILKRALIRRS
jgi:FlgD Ig-like domain